MQFKKQIPNFFTGLRVALVPVILVCLHFDTFFYSVIAAVVFSLASSTDYFDGFFARKFQVESLFGKLMDPIADKILVTSTLVLMIPSGRLDAYMVMILLARDMLIGGIRSVAASENMIIGAGVTAIQMLAIPFVLIRDPLFGIPIYEIGYWTLWVSVGLSVVSGAEYTMRYFRESKSF